MERRLIPVSCTLPTEGGVAQAQEWVALVDEAIEVHRSESGATLTLPARLLHSTTDLAAREAACCSFLDFDIASVSEETFTLSVRTQTAEGLAAINAIAPTTPD